MLKTENEIINDNDDEKKNEKTLLHVVVSVSRKC